MLRQVEQNILLLMVINIQLVIQIMDIINHMVDLMENVTRLKIKIHS